MAETNSTQDPLGRGAAPGAELLPGGEHARERRDQPAVGEEQIHEARPGHLEALELGPEPLLQRLAEALGDLARRGPEARREQQGGVRRVVAEVCGALERDRARPRRSARSRPARAPTARGREHLRAQLVQRAHRLEASSGRRGDSGGIVGDVLGHRLGGAVRRWKRSASSVLAACDTSCVSDQDSGSERHINIHLSPEIMGGVYANFANVSHSDYEFTVTFARVDHEVESDEVPGVVVSRVNISPRFMRELIDAMEDNYSKWRTREGIKNLPEYGGSEGEPAEDSRERRTPSRTVRRLAACPAWNARRGGVLPCSR